MIEKPKTYTTEEASEIIGVTRRCVYNYIKAGQIKAHKIRGHWFIIEEDLKYFLEHGTQENYFINVLQK